MQHIHGMNRDELQAIVDRVGISAVCESLGCDRVTLWRKLKGKAPISKPEAFMLRNLKLFKGK